MNEQPQPVPIQPAPVVATPVQPQAQPVVAHSSKARTVWGIVLLTVPTILFVLAIILSAVSNYAFVQETAQDGSLFAETSAAQAIINIFVFLFGLVAFLSWLPGIIIGIILLATKK